MMMSMAAAALVMMNTLGKATTTGATSMAAGDSRAMWSGRHRVNVDDSVSFDWVGVSFRVSVREASYLSATITTTSTFRGTRLKAYVAEGGYPLYPQVQVWVSPEGSPAGNVSTLWLGSKGNADVTVENLVDPQYGTGITTVVSFETDGSFEPAPPLQPIIPSPGQQQTATRSPSVRRMEIVGDSITAATNVVRPQWAPNCADSGVQSDWSQTYSGLLCHGFGAECSTIAVGGKCVMHECGGLQMPDYFTGLFFADAPNPTYDFKRTDWQPDAMVINLGTNDMRAIEKIGINATTGSGPGMDQFATEMVQFMKNATVLYGKPDIQFFLTSGPMENTTYVGTESAVAQAKAAGMKATLIDMRGACAEARYHGIGNSNLCDGCANHPGIEGHRDMYEAAWPVIQNVMGW